MSVLTEPPVTIRATGRVAASLAYIRDYYKVPARLGARVEFEGKPGRVCGAGGPRVLLRLDGEWQARLYHPTWNMIWLDENGPATRVPAFELTPVPTWQMATTLAEMVEPQWSGV